MRIPVAGKTASHRRVGLLTVLSLGLAMALPVVARAADCRGDAGSSVDWSQCDKRLLMLGGSDLSGANLSRTDFTYTDLRNSALKGANFEKAKLVRTALSGSKAEGTKFNKAEAYRGDFSGVAAAGATFVSAEMQRALFVGADLTKTDFSKAELGRANFEKATLTGSKFTLANLSRARFEMSVFEGPLDFENAFMLLTRIEGVDLSAATGLQQAQIQLACGDASTKLPADITAPTTWPCADEVEDED